MTVIIYQAMIHFSPILQSLDHGEKMAACCGKQAMARIVPSDSAKPKRPKVGVPTSARFEIPPDAFAPIAAWKLNEWALE